MKSWSDSLALLRESQSLFDCGEVKEIGGNENRKEV